MKLSPLGKIFIWMFLALGFMALPLLAFAQAGTLPATLDWTNPDIVNGLQVEKSNSATGTFTSIKQLPAKTITFTDATNAPGDTACYRVAYFNTSGMSPYAGPVCKTFPASPQTAPSSLTIK